MKPRLPRDLGKHAVLWLLLAIELLPFYVMLQVSMKDNRTFVANPWLPSDPSTWQVDNWIAALRLITPYLANSVFVSVTGTILTLVLAIAAAYFFARFRMPGSGLLWGFLLFLMLMPGIANLVPLFSLLRSMDLLNTLTALVVVGVSGAQVFNVFVLRGFIEDLPRDLFEAAEMDGAGHLRQITHVVIPMSAPILGTLAILAFLGKWNEFLLPLVVLRDPERFTVGVGLVYLDGEYVKHWGRIMAAYAVASVPLLIVFLFSVRLFVRGLSAGAVKG